MGLEIPEEQIPNAICKAADYLLKVLVGEKDRDTFNLQKLIDVMIVLGADWSQPGGSQVRFDVSVKEVFPSIHKSHKARMQANSKLFRNETKCPFRYNLRRAGYDLVELLNELNERCKNQKEERDVGENDYRI